MGSEVPKFVSLAAASTVASLVDAQVRQFPERPAVVVGTRSLSYRALSDRASRVAGLLAGRGVTRGSRLAVLAENCSEYLEVVVAAARLGAIVACQNWRLTQREIRACSDLVEPIFGFVSPRHWESREALGLPDARLLGFGEPYESAISEGAPRARVDEVSPEDVLLLLYTSGTTGRPKAAKISHRAQIVRNLVTRAEFGIAPHDAFVAWSPLYHMGAMDNSLGTLMTGGTVIVVDGFDSEALAAIVASEPLGWLLLMPGMVERFAQVLSDRAVEPKGVKVCGVMADLVPRQEIARITQLLGAPYANTFGSTETGCPPCSSNLIPVGEVPQQLAKQQSPFCEVKLVDPEDHEVGIEVPGELCMRGPTLFSGYFRDEAVNAREFRGGWFHMGDVFVRHADGTLDFVDRLKYLIKSGGENIYPAEIEQVLLGHSGVVEAAVVRRPDPRWGEVPVAFVAPRDEHLTKQELFEHCRQHLAGYKQPKGIEFLSVDEFPRSASGKVQRHELEKRFAGG